jgi:hypothetical protein
LILIINNYSSARCSIGLIITLSLVVVPLSLFFFSFFFFFLKDG